MAYTNSIYIWTIIVRIQETHSRCRKDWVNAYIISKFVIVPSSMSVQWKCSFLFPTDKPAIKMQLNVHSNRIARPVLSIFNSCFYFIGIHDKCSKRFIIVTPELVTQPALRTQPWSCIQQWKRWVNAVITIILAGELKTCTVQRDIFCYNNYLVQKNTDR